MRHVITNLFDALPTPLLRDRVGGGGYDECLKGDLFISRNARRC